jgi:hypothetical protein
MLRVAAFRAWQLWRKQSQDDHRDVRSKLRWANVMGRSSRKIPGFATDATLDRSERSLNRTIRRGHPLLQGPTWMVISPCMDGKSSSAKVRAGP